MRTIKGPGLYLAQFMGNKPPFDNLENIGRWAADLGFVGVEIPAHDTRLIDIDQAAESTTYCDELKGKLKDLGLEITELATHLWGQLVAVHPAYDALFDGFAAAAVRGNPKARTEWAVNQLKKCARASKHFGLKAHVTFSGALLWHTMYPWPQRPAGLVDTGFRELAKRWKPILDAFDDAGCDICYEIHPGEDLHDGVTFERFFKETGNHPRARIMYDPSHFVLQQLDYLAYIDIYHEFITAFHVKDAEFNPTGRSGVYGGYQSWIDRPGRFRSTGDGQVDFRTIFSKLARYDFPGWAVLEWECALKHPETGAKEGADFIKNHIIRTTDYAFDDYAQSGADEEANRNILGI